FRTWSRCRKRPWPWCRSGWSSSCAPAIRSSCCACGCRPACRAGRRCSACSGAQPAGPSPTTRTDAGALSERQTIFALASAPGPAGVAIFRISGPGAAAALQALTGRAPPQPRLARLAVVSDPRTGERIDRGLVLWFPGPGSFTGEDVAELHLHGGRAIAAAVTEALVALPDLRPAGPGEFSRRAFLNGKLDLTQAEGLVDLVNAETA